MLACSDTSFGTFFFLLSSPAIAQQEIGSIAHLFYFVATDL